MPRSREETSRILAAADLTCRLAEPFRVVLSGPPNVGKSSLLNAIVGFSRAIAVDRPGTTRDVLHADTVIDGLPFRFSDTAGIRDSDERIEQEGISRAVTAAASADLVLWVTDPATHAQMPPPLSSGVPDTSGVTVIPVLNKSDLLEGGAAGESSRQRRQQGNGELESSDVGEPIKTSAINGTGVESLMSHIVNRLAVALPKPGDPAVINDRQRECLLEISRAGSAEAMAQRLGELLENEKPTR